MTICCCEMTKASHNTFAINYYLLSQSKSIDLFTFYIFSCYCCCLYASSLNSSELESFYSLTGISQYFDDASIIYIFIIFVVTITITIHHCPTNTSNPPIQKFILQICISLFVHRNNKFLFLVSTQLFIYLYRHSLLSLACCDVNWYGLFMIKLYAKLTHA